MNKTLLQSLEQELKTYKKVLQQASSAIVTQNVSNYPIFVAHQHEANIGLSLIKKEEQATEWSINASTLEEFVTKNIVDNSKIEEFKTIYKTPNSHACIFVLSEIQSTFVFYPYA